MKEKQKKLLLATRNNDASTLVFRDEVVNALVGSVLT